MSSRSSSNFGDLHAVGWVKDAHGLRGEIYIQLYAKTADWLEVVDTLVFETDARVSLAIERAKPFKEGLLVKLTGVSDRTGAEALRKAQVLVPSANLVSAPGERVFLAELLGFTVFDGDAPVGLVVGVATNGPQDLLRVGYSGREVLIPLVDEFINKIDRENQRIDMILPEGLLTVEGEGE